MASATTATSVTAMATQPFVALQAANGTTTASATATIHFVEVAGRSWKSSHHGLFHALFLNRDRKLTTVRRYVSQSGALLD